MKKTVVTGWHVEIEPDRQWRLGFTDEQNAASELRDCEQMVSQVKRHVDGGRNAQIIREHDDRCSHCARPWTEDSAAYNGGCCDEDEKGNPDAEQAVSPLPATVSE